MDEVFCKLVSEGGAYEEEVEAGPRVGPVAGEAQAEDLDGALVDDEGNMARSMGVGGEKA